MTFDKFEFIALLLDIDYTTPEELARQIDERGDLLLIDNKTNDVIVLDGESGAQIASSRYMEMSEL